MENDKEIIEEINRLLNLSNEELEKTTQENFIGLVEELDECGRKIIFYKVLTFLILFLALISFLFTKILVIVFIGLSYLAVRKVMKYITDFNLKYLFIKTLTDIGK
jgi:hypothetical protein